MDIWAVFSFWLLWIKLLWTFLNKSFCRHMFSSSLDKFLGVELAGHRVRWYMFSFIRDHKTFLQSDIPFCILIMEVFQCSMSWATFGVVILFNFISSGLCVVISHCSCNSQLPADWRCWAHENVLFGYLNIFICDMPFQSFAH